MTNNPQQPSHWQNFRSRLEIVDIRGPVSRADAERRAIGRSTDAWLHEFEHEFEVRLPLSYREYAKVFGPGELAGYYQIRVPMGRQFNAWSDLSAFNDDSPRNNEVLKHEVHDDPERIGRMIFFCTTFAGDHFGWDPADLRDQETLEYGVYLLPRIERPVRVADSFPQFIEECVFGKRLDPWLGESDYERTFGPVMKD